MAGRSSGLPAGRGWRAERDLYLVGHLDALARTYENFRFVPVLSEPDGATDRRTGLVHEAALADFPDLSGFTVYLAGPPVMVAAARTALIGHGLRPQDFHADAHGEPPADAAGTC